MGRPCWGRDVGVVGVVLEAFGVGAVVDVLDVEVQAQHPALVDPALVDAQVQLVEGAVAGGVHLAVDRVVAVEAGVEHRADHRGARVAADQAEAAADLPVAGQQVAGHGGQDVGLVEVEQPLAAWRPNRCAARATACRPPSR